MGVDNLASPPKASQDTATPQATGGVGGLITQPQRPVQPQIQVQQPAQPQMQVQPQPQPSAYGMPSAEDLRSARENLDKSYQQAVETQYKKVADQKIKVDKQVVAEAKQPTDNIQPLVREWIMGEVAKKKSFFPNYGALSRQGQLEYLDAVAKSFSDQYGVPQEKVKETLLKQFATSSFDKTHNPDPHDKAWWKYFVNGAHNTGATFYSAFAGLGQSIWGLGVLGTAVVTERLADAVDGVHTLANIGQDKKLKFDRDKFRAEVEKSSFVQGLIQNSNRADRWREWAQHQYSESYQEAHKRGAEVRQQDGLWAGVAHEAKNFDVTAISVAPDILAGMATIVATGGVGGFIQKALPKTFGAISTANVAKSSLEVPTKSLLRSIKEIGVPLSAYGTGTQVSQLRPTNGLPNQQQQLALGTMFVTSAVANGVAGRFGASLEASLAGVLGRNATYLSNNLAGRIAQGVLVETGVGAFDSAQQAMLVVAQGSKENPQFSWENIKKNQDEIYYAGILGGVLGGLSGGVGAYYAGRAQGRNASANAVKEPTSSTDTPTSDTTPTGEKPTVTEPTAVEQPTTSSVEATAEQQVTRLSVLDDNVAPELQATIAEINQVSQEANHTKESLDYLDGLIHETKETLAELDAVHGGREDGLSAYHVLSDALTKLEKESASMRTTVAERAAKEAEAIKEAEALKEMQVSEGLVPTVTPPEKGQYVTNKENAEGRVIEVEADSTLFYNEATNQAFIANTESLSTEQTMLPARGEMLDDSPTLKMVGDRVDEGNQSYAIYESAPLYEVGSDGNLNRVGDYYSLRDQSGGSTPRIVYNSSNRFNSLGNLVGSDLPQTPRNSVPTIEVRKRERALESSSGSGDKTLEQQYADREYTRNRERQIAEARRDKQRAEAKAEHRQELISPAHVATDRIDYLNAVVPQMFEAPSAQALVARALKSGIEQQILDTLHTLAQMTPPSGGKETAHTRDQRTALNMLKGNGDAVQMISEYNPSYIIPLSSDMQELVTSSASRKTKISANPTSILLEGKNKRKENTRTEDEIIQDDLVDMVLAQTLTRDELTALNKEQVSAIVGRIVDDKMTADLGRIIIEADLTRTKSELPSHVMERIYNEYVNDPAMTPDRRAILQNLKPELDRLGAKVDQVSREMEADAVRALEAQMIQQAEVVANATKEVTPVYADPTVDLSSLIGTIQNSLDASNVSSGNATVGTYNTSADVMITVLNAEGIIANQVRSLNLWKSATARKLMRKAGVDPRKIAVALRRIQDTALEAVLSTSAMGQDIRRATQILELANIVATSGVASRSTTVINNPVPNRVSVSLPVAQVSPLQASINQAMVENGVFINDTPINAVDRMTRISNEVRFETESFDNITAQVVHDLGLESFVNLTETQQAFIDQITQHNREVVRLDSLHAQRYALIEGIANLEIERAKQGGDGKVLEQVQSNQDQLASVDTAIAVANVEITKHLNRIAELRESDPMLNATFPDNNFYMVDHSFARNATLTPETLAVLNDGTFDYNNHLIETAVKLYEVDTTVENVLAIKRSQAIHEHLVDIDHIEQQVQGNRDDVPDRQVFPREQSIFASSIEEAVNTKMATDAIHEIGDGNLLDRSTTDVLSEYAVIDEGFGTATIEGITQYLDSDGANFVPASAIDETNFSGTYPFLNNLPINENGFVHITDVRSAMAKVAKANADYPTTDGLKAQAYLQATVTARALRGKTLGMDDSFISHANPAFKEGNDVMTRADATLGDLVENRSLVDAIKYISELSGLPATLQSTTRFLAEVAHRYMPSVRVEIMEGGNFGAEYNYDTGVITFTGGAHKNPYAVSHEYTHALVDALFNAETSHLTDAQYQARRALEDIYAYAREQGSLTEHAQVGVREWIAESFSNVEQADLMHQMRTDTPSAEAFFKSSGESFVEKARSLYDYFVSKIRGLFGLDTVAKSREAQDKQLKKNTPFEETDAVHTGLTDIMSAVHLYSKPTSNKAFNKFEPRKNKYGEEGSSDNAELKNTIPPAITPQGDTVSGLPEGTRLLYVKDMYNPDHKYTGYDGVIKRIGDTNRYQLTMWNGHVMEQTVGTLPQLKAQLDVEGVARYSTTDHVVTKDGAYNIDALALEYSRKTGTYYMVGQYPKPLREWIANRVEAILDKRREKFINKDGTLKTHANHPNEGNTSFRLQVLENLARMFSYTSQFLRPSNILDGYQRMYEVILDGITDPKIRDAFKSEYGNVDLGATLRSAEGEGSSYGQNRNSRLHSIKNRIDKLIPDATDREQFGLYLVAKHSLEREERYKGAVRSGEAVSDAWSGFTYGGKRGKEGANLLLKHMAEREGSKELLARFEKASQMLHQEHARLLKDQYVSGYIDRDTYYAFKKYEHYVPLINRVGDGKDIYVSDVRQLMGRSTNAGDGYIALLDYLNKTNALMQTNIAKQAIAKQLELLAPLGVIQVSKVEARLQFNPETGGYSYRNVKASDFKPDSMYYYRDGKQHILTANVNHPRGASFARFFDSLNPPKTATNKHVERFRKASTQVANMEAATSVGTSLTFLLQSIGWNTTIPLINGQNAFRTDAKSGWSISLRTYKFMAQNLLRAHNIASAHAGGNYARKNVSPDSMYAMYQRQGGGIGGGQMLLGNGDGNALHNTSIQNVLAGGDALQKRFPLPLADNNQSRSSLALTAMKYGYLDAMGKIGDVSNIPDAFTRFSAWQAGVMTLGTPAMKKALKENDHIKLEALLEENPVIKAQLNTGSKEIIGNFQEKSMIGRWASIIPFLNAGFQGAELFKSILLTKQGWQAGSAFFILGVLNALASSRNDDNIGLDGKNSMLRNQTSTKAFTVRLADSLFAFPLDYAIRPFYASGLMIGGMAFGDLGYAESFGIWNKAFKDTVVPITKGQTDNEITNTVSAVMPSLIKAVAMPLVWNTSQFSTDINGKALYLNEEDKVVASDNAPNSAFYGKLGWINKFSQNVPYAPSAPTLESALSNLFGEPYRVGLEASRVSNSAGDVLRYATRSITPIDNDVYRYTNEFRENLTQIQIDNQRAYDSPNIKHAEAFKELNNYASDVNTQLARMTSDNGHNSATIRYFLERAQTDEEKLYWTNEKKSVQFNRAVLSAEANTNIDAFRAEMNGNEEKGNVLLQNLEESQERYRDNPTRVINLLKQVRGR